MKVIQVKCFSAEKDSTGYPAKTFGMAGEEKTVKEAAKGVKEAGKEFLSVLDKKTDEFIEKHATPRMIVFGEKVADLTATGAEKASKALESFAKWLRS